MDYKVLLQYGIANSPGWFYDDLDIDALDEEQARELAEEIAISKREALGKSVIVSHVSEGDTLGLNNLRCNLCSLCLHPGQEMIKSSGSENPDILIISDQIYPGDEAVDEVVKNRGSFEKLLKEIGLDPTKVRYTSAVRCAARVHPLGNPGIPNDYHMHSCSTHLWDEIDKYRPRVLVPTGPISTKILDSREQKGGYITKKTVRDVPYFVIPTIHPYYYISNPYKNKGKFKSDLSLVHKLLSQLDAEPEDPECLLLRDEQALTDYIEEVLKAYNDGVIDRVAFDIETNAKPLWSRDLRITGFSLAYQSNRGVFVPVEHESLMLDEEYVSQELYRLNATVPFICQNAMFDSQGCLRRWGKPLKLIDDTLLGSYLVRGERDRGHGLKAQVCRLLPKFAFYEERVQEQVAIHGWGNVPLDVLQEYGAMDSIVTWRLNEHWNREIDANGLRFIYDQLIRSTHAFVEIGAQGNALDGDAFDEYYDIYEDYIRDLYVKLSRLELVKNWAIDYNSITPEEYTRDINEYEKASIERLRQEGNAIGKYRLNLRSSKQVASCLSGAIQLPVVSTTPTGNPSYGEDPLVDILEGLAKKKESLSESPGNEDAISFIAYQEYFIDLIRKIRKALKIRDSYWKSLKEYTYKEYAETGCCRNDAKFDSERVPIIHTGYKLFGTATGRLATKDPSLHVVPYNSDPKKCFVSRWYRRGGIFLCSDFSQLELRVLAAETNDENFKGAYAKGLDIHRYVASFIYDKPYDEVTDLERRYTKTQSFLLVYGGGPSSMAEQMNIPIERAKELFANYERQYPSLFVWIKKMHKMAHSLGYCKNLFGRRRQMICDKSDKGSVAKMERESQNSPIQGGGSDCCLLALLDIYDFLKDTSSRSNINGTVHDSILLDVYPTELYQVYLATREMMEFTLRGVPLKCDLSIGYSWNGQVSVDSQTLPLEEEMREKRQKTLEESNFDIEPQFTSLGLELQGKELDYDVTYDREKEVALFSVHGKYGDYKTLKKNCIDKIEGARAELLYTEKEIPSSSTKIMKGRPMESIEAGTVDMKTKFKARIITPLSRSIHDAFKDKLEEAKQRRTIDKFDFTGD